MGRPRNREEAPEGSSQSFAKKDAPKKPPPPVKAFAVGANDDLPAYAGQARQDSASDNASEMPSDGEPSLPPPYPEGGWPLASAEYQPPLDAGPPEAGQTVWGYYINPTTGEWIPGSMLMPTSSANLLNSFNNWGDGGYQGEYSNFEHM